MNTNTGWWFLTEWSSHKAQATAGRVVPWGSEENPKREVIRPCSSVQRRTLGYNLDSEFLYWQVGHLNHCNLLSCWGFQPQPSSLWIQWDWEMTMECSWGKRVSTWLYSPGNRSRTRIKSVSSSLQVCNPPLSLPPPRVLGRALHIVTQSIIAYCLGCRSSSLSVG